jgi:peptidyl-prolyl cis-trans isomerase C
MALGLVPSDAELDQQIATVKSQFPGEKEFTAALEAQGMTPADLRNDLRENMGIQKVISTKLEPMVQITDEAKHKFYNENQDKMQSPEQVRASHILVKFEHGATPEQKEAARKKAADLLTQIKGGADFATLAKANSDDPGSAAKGGDLGLFPKGAMVPPFDQAAFALKVGEVSDLVESPFGFHIIKVAEHKPAGVSPYEEVQEKIGQYLHNRELKAKLDAHIAELKAKAQVQVFI